MFTPFDCPLWAKLFLHQGLSWILADPSRPSPGKKWLKEIKLLFNEADAVPRFLTEGSNPDLFVTLW
jgi:hypothetical protein